MRARGFTLIELGVVLGLLALAMGVAIPSVNALTGAKLRSSATQAAGLMREAYARAAITGKVHRIVFDIDKSAFWLERTEERFTLSATKLEADSHGRGGKTLEEREKEAKERAESGGEAGEIDPLAVLGLRGGGAGADALQALTAGGMDDLGQTPMGVNLSVDEDLEETLKKRLRRGAAFSPVGDEAGKAQVLEGDVRFHRVWVEHQKDAFVGGSSEIYFFPTGYTQRAIVTLTDDEHGERVLAIELNPLTARTRIVSEDLEVPR